MSFSDLNQTSNNSYLVRISSDVLSFLKPINDGSPIELKEYDIARLGNLKQFFNSAIDGSKVIDESKVELQFHPTHELTPTPVSAFGIALEAFDETLFSPTDNGKIVKDLSDRLYAFTKLIDYLINNGHLNESHIEESRNLVSFLEGISNSIISFDRMDSENDRDYAFSA